MPNHWHLMLWPEQDGQLSEFKRLLTVTHTQRWHSAHHTSGTGPLYQGRFKSFPVEEGGHVLKVCRYIERNALRGRLVKASRDWPWGSLNARLSPEPLAWLLKPAAWPVRVPRDWEHQVDQPHDVAEEAAIRRSITRGQPFGTSRWTTQTAARLGLQHTLRPRGRPRSTRRTS